MGALRMSTPDPRPPRPSGSATRAPARPVGAGSFIRGKLDPDPSRVFTCRGLSASRHYFRLEGLRRIVLEPDSSEPAHGPPMGEVLGLSSGSA